MLQTLWKDLRKRLLNKEKEIFEKDLLITLKDKQLAEMEGKLQEKIKELHELKRVIAEFDNWLVPKRTVSEVNNNNNNKPVTSENCSSPKIEVLFSMTPQACTGESEGGAFHSFEEGFTAVKAQVADEDRAATSRSELNSRLKTFLSVCATIHHRGWSDATGGNFSLRISDTDFLISGSGLDKGILREEDLVMVRNGVLESHPFLKPSRETDLHQNIYFSDRRIQCILHTHSIPATVLSYYDKNEFSIKLSGFEMIKALDNSYTHETVVSLPLLNNDSLSIIIQELNQLREENRLPHGFIIRGHGLYTWGNSEQQAKQNLECLEFLLAVRLNLEMLSTTSKPSCKL